MFILFFSNFMSILCQKPLRILVGGASLRFNPAQHMLSKNVFKRNKNDQRGPFSNTSSYILRGAGWRSKQKNGNANFLAALQFPPLYNKRVLLKILPNVKLGIVSTVLCVLGKLLGSWFVGKLFLKHCNQSRLHLRRPPTIQTDNLSPI